MKLVKGTPAATGLVLGCLVLVTACDSTKDALGLNSQAPDEFAVVTKAPLVIPPDYRLRPPTPGQTPPHQPNPQQQAKAALESNVGESRSPVPWTAAGSQALNTRPSAGESALLQLANVSENDAAARRQLAEENQILAKKDKNFTDRLIFWQTQPPLGTVVDAKKEAKRLQQNAATGKSVTDGETPKVERRKRAIFEGIF